MRSKGLFLKPASGRAKPYTNSIHELSVKCHHNHSSGYIDLIPLYIEYATVGRNWNLGCRLRRLVMKKWYLAGEIYCQSSPDLLHHLSLKEKSAEWPEGALCVSRLRLPQPRYLI
jgi:hypothetical protein